MCKLVSVCVCVCVCVCVVCVVCVCVCVCVCVFKFAYIAHLSPPHSSLSLQAKRPLFFQAPAELAQALPCPHVAS